MRKCSQRPARLALQDGAQCEDYVAAGAFKAEPCRSAPQVLFRPDSCWLRDIVPLKFVSVSVFPPLLSVSSFSFLKKGSLSPLVHHFAKLPPEKS